MDIFLKRRTSILLGLIVIAAASVATADQHAVVVHNPWVKEAPPSARILAAYMNLKNTGDKSQVVTSISSPAFERVKMHKSEIIEGMAQMIHIENLEIPPHGQVEFNPGGYHFMLIGRKQPLRAGDEVSLTLVFSDKSRLTIIAEVLNKMGDGAMDHSGMGHSDMETMDHTGMDTMDHSDMDHTQAQ